MKILILILVLVFLSSCDDDEKIVETVIPPGVESKCEFDKFDVKYKYVETRDNEGNIIDIFKITRYKEEYDDYKVLTINILSANSRDSMDNLKLVELGIACNYTHTEFDIETCSIVNEIEFGRSRAICDGLDDYLYDRVIESELYSYSNDTLVLYESRNDWYHYFVVEDESEVIENPDLPEIKFNSNNIYARNDTMHIPLNINYLRNDSTKCYVMGQEVIPEFLNMNTSFIVFPEFELKGNEDYNLRRIVDFKAISNEKTICEIDSIIFFRNLWFNNVEIFVENVYFELHHTRSSYHPYHGSSFTHDSTIKKNTHWKSNYNFSKPDFNPALNYYFPHFMSYHSGVITSFSIKKPFYEIYGFKGSSEFILYNTLVELEKNIHSKEIIFSDVNYLKENLEISYNEEYMNGPSSTRINERKYIKKFRITDSSYVKIKIWRD